MRTPPPALLQPSNAPAVRDPGSLRPSRLFSGEASLDTALLGDAFGEERGSSSDKPAWATAVCAICIN